MNQANQTTPPEDQPVAYDTEGRPLYLHPETSETATPSPVYMHRPAEPAPYTVSEQTAKRRERSCELFPDLDLGDTEYVVQCAQRHPIGLFSIWAGEVLGMAVIAAVWIMLMTDPTLAGGLLDSSGAKYNFTLLAGGLEVLLLLVGWIGTVIYQGNRFIVTNERVIEYVRTGLFAHRRKTIDLSGIEDVSYWQTGILQTILGYGSIRLSTVGDETTYRFTLVSEPEKQSRLINATVQACKAGRPVPDDILDPMYSQAKA